MYAHVHFILFWHQSILNILKSILLQLWQAYDCHSAD